MTTTHAPSRWTFWQTEAAELAVNAAVAFRNRSARTSDTNIRRSLRNEMRYEAKKAVAAARRYMEGRR